MPSERKPDPGEDHGQDSERHIRERPDGANDHQEQERHIGMVRKIGQHAVIVQAAVRGCKS